LRNSKQQRQKKREKNIYINFQRERKKYQHETTIDKHKKKEEEQNLATDRELLFFMATVRRQVKIK
jgi:hypothetical protein